MALNDFVKVIKKSALLAHLQNVDEKTAKWRKDLLDAIVTKDELVIQLDYLSESHADLTDRDLDDQHPASAVAPDVTDFDGGLSATDTDLQTALETIDDDLGHAIHDNVAGEISAIDEKAIPVNADLFVIEDSASSYAKKKLQMGNIRMGGFFGDTTIDFDVDEGYGEEYHCPISFQGDWENVQGYGDPDDEWTMVWRSYLNQPIWYGGDWGVDTDSCAQASYPQITSYAARYIAQDYEDGTLDIWFRFQGNTTARRFCGVGVVSKDAFQESGGVFLGIVPNKLSQPHYPNGPNEGCYLTTDVREPAGWDGVYDPNVYEYGFYISSGEWESGKFAITNIGGSNLDAAFVYHLRIKFNEGWAGARQWDGTWDLETVLYPDDDMDWDKEMPFNFSLGSPCSVYLFAQGFNNYLGTESFIRCYQLRIVHTIDGIVISEGLQHGDLTGLAHDDHLQYLLVDGSRSLTDDWDAGSVEIRAETFESDVATGTAPFVVASETLVDNLNADLLDGNEAAAFAAASHAHDSDYISIILAPGDNKFPYQTATGELDDSTYDAASFAAASHEHVEADITDLDHTDTAAIHDNVAGEINAVADKATPDDADVILIEDSTDTWAKKKITVSDLTGGGGADEDAIHDNVAGEINAVADKEAPEDSDVLLIEDSSDSWAKKKITVSDLTSGSHNHDADYISILDDAIAGNFASLTHGGEISDSGYDASDFALYDHSHDHGDLSGLTDDDHTQYLLASDATDRSTFATNWIDLTDSGETTLHTHAGVSGADTDAIHDNVSGEIHAITEKAAPILEDEIVIEDSEDTYAKKRIKIGNISFGTSGEDLDVDVGFESAEGYNDGESTATQGDWGDYPPYAQVFVTDIQDSEQCARRYPLTSSGGAGLQYEPGGVPFTISSGIVDIYTRQKTLANWGAGVFVSGGLDLTGDKIALVLVTNNSPAGQGIAMWLVGSFTVAGTEYSDARYGTPNSTTIYWTNLTINYNTNTASASFWSGNFGDKPASPQASLTFATALPSPAYIHLNAAHCSNTGAYVNFYEFRVDSSGGPSGTISDLDHGSLTGLNDDDHGQYLRTDGARALIHDWDAGDYEIRSESFESDVATGTIPLVVASTTKCTNLNADYLDGLHDTAFVKANGTVALSTNWDAGSFEIRSATFESDVATGTIPIVIASTTKCTNLNADQLDGLHDTAFIKANGTVALSADWDAGSYEIRAQTLESDVATGTAPLTVASTTMVDNLSAQYLYNLQYTDFMRDSLTDSAKLVITVKNNTESTIAAGNVCYITGDDSGTPTIELADADAEATSSGMIVLTSEGIADSGDTGEAIVIGKLSGLSGMTAGAKQYISTTDGGFTETAPSGSGDVVRIIGYALTTTAMFFNPSQNYTVIP